MSDDFIMNSNETINETKKNFDDLKSRIDIVEFFNPKKTDHVEAYNYYRINKKFNRIT